MRLLTCNEDGKLTIESFSNESVPPYAILSHTWGAENEEVTFADIINGDGLTKLGYEKVRFCGKQAQYDGVQYFWIDTCCIDKMNKAEHSHAIRSMFRWYQNATKCYVYLSDVSKRKRKAISMPAEFTWESTFISSRWFNRGWTLQELLAPRVVEFFSQECDKLGDRRSLQSLIHKITSIPYEALNGAPLSNFEVDERLRWIGDRVTKLKEDKAYSLSGICDVEIAPVYGEGEEEAFRRLHYKIRKLKTCLRDLRPSDPHSDKKRIQETKGGLLEDSYRWVLNNTTFQQWQQHPDSRLLWVKGDPGKGKTMLLCGIIDELQKTVSHTDTVSYFFCQATDSRINSATMVLRGLLYMLANQRPSLASHVCKKYEDAGKSLFEDVNAWTVLKDVFVDLLQDPALGTAYLVVDALDECITDLPKLLEFVAKQSSRSARVKWIVSSRNWPSIEAQLQQAGHKVKLSLELNAKSVATAVNIFIQQKVEHLAQQEQYSAELRSAVLEHLMINANDTFLWVALVCQNLKVTPRRHVLKKLALFPPGLDALYKRMIDQISQSDDAEVCRQVLALTTVLYRPVTISELVPHIEQLQDVVDDIREIISLCGSFLTLREDMVYFVHQSARDFLYTQGVSEIFPHGVDAVHRAVFSNSLAILSSTLHRDMYRLKAPGFPVKDVEAPHPDPLDMSRYACVYWIDHLYDSNLEILDDSHGEQQALSMVNKFLREKYLYWLEGLSLCKGIEKGVVSITKLWSLVQVMRDQGRLAHLIQDARRFIMYHKQAIQSYPLQAYASALLFSPTGSLTRQLFQHEEPQGIKIKPPMSIDWSACLQTLEGHSSSVSSVAFSHDSTRLASASWDRTVKIWDASSGACLQTLERHSDFVSSVAFSHDSTRLASASWDSTVKIWDASLVHCE